MEQRGFFSLSEHLDAIGTVWMGIPILVSRPGVTVWGVELACRTGLTLIARVRGKCFVALAGLERLIFDTDAAEGADESATLRRREGQDSNAA